MSMVSIGIPQHRESSIVNIAVSTAEVERLTPGVSNTKRDAIFVEEKRKARTDNEGQDRRKQMGWAEPHGGLVSHES